MPTADTDEVRRLFLAIGQEIRHARGDRSADSLGQAIGKDQTTISNYERGGTIPLQVLWAIEDELGLRRGELQTRAQAIAAEVTPVSSTTEQAVTDDPDLDEAARNTVLYVYRYCVGVGKAGVRPRGFTLPPPPMTPELEQATAAAERATEEHHRRAREADQPAAS